MVFVGGGGEGGMVVQHPDCFYLYQELSTEGKRNIAFDF